jgi:hypothetical protein
MIYRGNQEMTLEELDSGVLTIATGRRRKGRE